MAWFPDTTEIERAPEIAPPLAPALSAEWREEEVAQLLALRADGLTCVQVAERMGKTKGMIVGKLNRLRGYRKSSARSSAGRAIPLLALPSPEMFGRRPRDENGWRIPEEGTRSRRVYDLLKVGTPITDITADIGCPAQPYVFLIKNPDHKPQTTRYEARQAKLAKRVVKPPPAVIYLSGPVAHVRKRADGIFAVKVSLSDDRASITGKFDHVRDANGFVMHCSKDPGEVCFVYELGRRRLGVSWQPIETDIWSHAQQIADRDIDADQRRTWRS